MPMELVSDTLIRTLAPDRPDALGISVARFKGNDDGAQLVLDVVCQDSAEGESLCRGPRVQAIKDGFKLFVHSER